MKVIEYTLCLNNTDYSASLEIRKIYPIVEAEENDPQGYIRVIDESGEDYLYLKNRFTPISLPPKIKKQVEASFELI